MLAGRKEARCYLDRAAFRLEACPAVYRLYIISEHVVRSIRRLFVDVVDASVRWMKPLLVVTPPLTSERITLDEMTSAPIGT